MIDTLFRMFSPFFLGKVSPMISDMIFSLPTILKQKALETNTKADDALVFLCEILFAIAKGDMKEAEGKVSAIPAHIRTIFSSVILVLHEKAKSTPNPYDNMIVAALAVIFKVELRG